MKQVSIRQAILNAVEESDPSLSRFQAQMYRWAQYIEKEIGSKLAYKFKAKKYTLTGCTIDLPDDCYRVVKIIPGDYEDECNAQYMGEAFYPAIREDDTHEDDYYSWLWQPAEALIIDPYIWEEIPGQVHLIQEFTGQDLTLVYQYIETDDQGFWMVNESHIEAIAQYILYKSAKKFTWKINKSDKLLRSSHIGFVQMLKQDYNTAVRHARAEDGRETPYQTGQY